MKNFLKISWVWFIVCLSCAAQNLAVRQYSGDPSGIPDGWPETVRNLGATNGPLLDGEVLMTHEQYGQLLTTMSPAKESWNKLQESRQFGPMKVPNALRARLAKSEFEELKLDALQSVFVGKLLHAYFQTTELLLLVTKAVAGTAATNNLTVAERQRVAALRPQLVFPQQPDFTQADRDRAVAIRDNVLIPHYQLYQAAKDLLSKIPTNATPIDPLASTNWPAVTIGD